MREFAFIAHEKSLHLGWGACTRSSEALKNAFYINNFDLSAEKPWVKFEHTESFKNWDVLQDFLSELPVARDWQRSEFGDFAKQYQKASEAFHFQDLRKILLSVCDEGKEVTTLKKIPESPSYFYGWRLGEDSSWGLSPELLFYYRFASQIISTMALAGTFRDNTEARHVPEHMEVTAFFKELALRNRLTMQFQPTQTVEYGSLKHIKTEVNFSRVDPARSLNEWVREFHPTPALGVSPRNEQTLSLLTQLRTKLPEYFGAPFGFSSEEYCQLIVMIRGVFASGEKICRPIGVGVTPASTLNAEWDEVELKRQVLEQMWTPLI